MTPGMPEGGQLGNCRVRASGTSGATSSHFYDLIAHFLEAYLIEKSPDFDIKCRLSAATKSPEWAILGQTLMGTRLFIKSKSARTVPFAPTLGPHRL